ncbi:hypothetical protein B0H11DRAFT_17647 [Mycena galericulata]|nr:hypothetical protein B0H11DRAFT_17647 [Mycena galericulata]
MHRSQWSKPPALTFGRYPVYILLFPAGSISDTLFSPAAHLSIPASMGTELAPEASDVCQKSCLLWAIHGIITSAFYMTFRYSVLRPSQISCLVSANSIRYADTSASYSPVYRASALHRLRERSSAMR